MRKVCLRWLRKMSIRPFCAFSCYFERHISVYSARNVQIPAAHRGKPRFQTPLCTKQPLEETDKRPTTYIAVWFSYEMYAERVEVKKQSEWLPGVKPLCNSKKVNEKQSDSRQSTLNRRKKIVHPEDHFCQAHHRVVSHCNASFTSVPCPLIISFVIS